MIWHRSVWLVEGHMTRRLEPYSKLALFTWWARYPSWCFRFCILEGAATFDCEIKRRMHYMRKNISPTTVKICRTQKPCLGEKLLTVKKYHSEWSYHWHWNEVMYNMGTEYSPSQVGIICWGSRQCGTSGTPWSPPSPPPRWSQWHSGDLSPCLGGDFPLQDDAAVRKREKSVVTNWALLPGLLSSLTLHVVRTEEQKEKTQI